MPGPVSGVPPPKVVAPQPSDSVWSVDFWFRKIIKIVVRSQSVLHQILFRLQWALPQTHLGKLTALVQHWRSHGWSGVTPLFENMGFAICRHLYRNMVGWCEVGRGGIQNVIEYRLSLSEEYKIMSRKYRRKLHLRTPPIPNSIFSGEGRVSGFPAKLARMALVKSLR